MKPYIIYSTTDTKKEAKSLAKLLLEKKLAACIQIQKIRSLYSWKNQLCEDKEYLLCIKTKKGHYKKIEREIKENHSYDVPEIIATPITKLDKNYKKFIKENT
jgi:periplasmic divalent cation tolerance protein